MMERKKQINYSCPPKKKPEADVEFAYELGAEIMEEEVRRKEEYLRQQHRGLKMEMGKDPDFSLDCCQKKQQSEERTASKKDAEFAEEPLFNQQNFYNRQHCAPNQPHFTDSVSQENGKKGKR